MISRMNKRKLTIEEVQRLVSQNCYQVDKKYWFLSRCIDGRYNSHSAIDSVAGFRPVSAREKLRAAGSPSTRATYRGKTQGEKPEPLAKPGADIGDLMIVFAANREYGLEIKKEKIFKAVLETVGGFENFRFHTDDHNLNSKSEILNSFLGCGHFKQAYQDSAAYSLSKEEIKAINKFLTEAKKKGAKGEVLQGEHLEGAVLIVKGDHWSIAPQLMLNNEVIEAFIYQKTLDDKRRRILAKHLLPYVKAPFSVDEEYLYQIMSQVADNQLLETVSRLAKDLPVYEVAFEEDGGFEIKQL